MQGSDRITVSGRTGMAVLKAFGNFTLIGSKFLLDEGLGHADAHGQMQLDPDTWYPLGGWLRALNRIGREFDDRVIFKVGFNMVNEGPRGSTDLLSAIRNLDGAYHRNHRLDGQLMWDEAAQRSIEGIGRYGFEPVNGANAILSRCDNPYPCAFDHGVLSALSRKFEPTSEVTHAPGDCRKNGKDSCTYRIVWKTR